MSKKYVMSVSTYDKRIVLELYSTALTIGKINKSTATKLKSLGVALQNHVNSYSTEYSSLNFSNTMDSIRAYLGMHTTVELCKKHINSVKDKVEKDIIKPLYEIMENSIPLDICVTEGNCYRDENNTVKSITLRNTIQLLSEDYPILSTAIDTINDIEPIGEVNLDNSLGNILNAYVTAINEDASIYMSNTEVVKSALTIRGVKVWSDCNTDIINIVARVIDKLTDYLEDKKEV